MTRTRINPPAPHEPQGHGHAVRETGGTRVCVAGQAGIDRQQ